MSGYDVAKQLRREPGFDSVLLVAVTGYGTETDRQSCFDAGFDLHIVKPASIETLEKSLSHPKLRRLATEPESDAVTISTSQEEGHRSDD